MARKSKKEQSVDKKKLHRIFKVNYNRIVDENTKLFGPKNNVWGQLKRKFDLTQTTKAIYTSALGFMKSKENRKKRGKVEPVDTDKSFDSIISAASSVASNESDKSEINFFVKLSARKWQTIAPVQKEYVRSDSKRNKTTRTYTVLPPGLWSNVIQSEISNKRSDLPCRWTFVKNTVTEYGDQYLKIFAVCNKCTASLNGFIETEPEQNDEAVIHFSIKEFDESMHADGNEKNVRLTTEHAKTVYSQKGSASKVQRKMASENITMFKIPTKRMSTANAVKCHRYKERQKDKLDQNPLFALYKLQCSDKYGSIIRSTGMKPVYAIYTSNEQIMLYKQYRKKNYTSVLCDSTSNVANKIGKFWLKFYFFYQFC